MHLFILHTTNTFCTLIHIFCDFLKSIFPNYMQYHLLIHVLQVVICRPVFKSSRFMILAKQWPKSKNLLSLTTTSKFEVNHIHNCQVSIWSVTTCSWVIKLICLCLISKQKFWSPWTMYMPNLKLIGWRIVWLSGRNPESTCPMPHDLLWESDEH